MRIPALPPRAAVAVAVALLAACAQAPKGEPPSETAKGSKGADLIASSIEAVKTRLN